MDFKIELNTLFISKTPNSFSYIFQVSAGISLRLELITSVEK